MKEELTSKEDGYYDKFGNWYSRTMIDNPAEYRFDFEVEDD
jgi:hypothetical protein